MSAQERRSRPGRPAGPDHADELGLAPGVLVVRSTDRTKADPSPPRVGDARSASPAPPTAPGAPVPVGHRRVPASPPPRWPTLAAPAPAPVRASSRAGPPAPALAGPPAPALAGSPAPAPPGALGPGPGLVVVAAGLLLVAVAVRWSSASVALPAGLPAAPPWGLVGLGVVLAVLLAATLVPRWSVATRVLLSASSLGALGVALVLLDRAEGRPGSSATTTSALLGLDPRVATVLTAVVAPVVIDLAVVAAARRCAAPPRACVAAGSVAALLALVLPGVTSGPALASLSGGAGVLLLVVSLPRGAASPAPATPASPTEAVDPADRGEPGAATSPAGATPAGRRADLAPAALLGVVALVAALADSAGSVSAVTVLVALLAVGERLGRWRARGQLEVLARCLAGAAFVGVATGAVVVALVGPGAGALAWRLTVIVAALLGLVVAHRLPRPAAPAYTRLTHLRVVRGLPWGLAALALVVLAVVLPRLVVTLGEPSVRAASGAPRGPTGPAGQVPGPTGEPATQHPSGTDLPARPSATRPSIRLGPVQGTQVDVVVHSPRATGPLEIRTRIGADEISYPLVTLPHGGDLTVAVSLPERGRFVVTLNDVTTTTPLQTLVVER